MNLVIDVGNTAIKLGVFEHYKLVDHKRTTAAAFFELFQKTIQKYNTIDAVIFSSVGNLDTQSLSLIKDYDLELVELSHRLKMPFKNLYLTPETLGVDRLALTAAAVSKFPKKNVLIIDAGTCITYDFKNSNEEYLGGAIAPGIALRYSSLHHYTAKLPLLSIKEPDALIGKSTEQAIHTGVILGVIAEIDGIIREYCNIYDDLTVILTGGDAHFLSKRLKNSIFATSNFLLEGLNYILGINKSK
ncbi:type III pantothenate kinase [Aquimarina brevivitae]|uniref:Type III pantothenate kinase n=1 Tax=Aquimarina brevivitae TaxID=323412 RepID=A0A4Q7PGY5_9FLAO|nr:type III pantothenate kinase [Aquimarina brevivitae]RZS99784.1 type III pantothenate kinase [Aquimarina brevivitae]